jgi:hypothetical protein
MITESQLPAKQVDVPDEISETPDANLKVAKKLSDEEINEGARGLGLQKIDKKTLGSLRSIGVGVEQEGAIQVAAGIALFSVEHNMKIIEKVSQLVSGETKAAPRINKEGDEEEISDAEIIVEGAKAANGLLKTLNESAKTISDLKRDGYLKDLPKDPSGGSQQRGYMPPPGVAIQIVSNEKPEVRNA